MPAGAHTPSDGDEPPLYRHPVPDPAWLDLRREPILDPARRVVDPHHHLWRRDDQTYLLPEFLEDLGSGHDVAATVFVQCHWAHRPDGPEALRPVGETEAVRRIAEEADARGGRTRVCAGIVGFADLALGDAWRRCWRRTSPLAAAASAACATPPRARRRSAPASRPRRRPG